MIQSGSNNTTGQEAMFQFQPIYHSSLVVLSIIITGHNLLVLVVYIKERTLHTTTNFLLSNLACCDMITGCLFLPLLIASALNKNTALNFVVNVFADLTVIGIVLSLTVVTIERYLNLCYPFKYTEIVSKFKVIVTVAVIWSVATIMSLIPISWSIWNITHDAANAADLSRAYQVHSLVILVFFFLTPTVVSLYALISMFCTIHRLTSTDIMATAATRRKRQRKVVIIFLAMYICLIICWTPMIVVRLMVDFRLNGVIDNWALELFIVLRGLPSFTNPLIYVWCKADFRKAMLKIKAIEKVNTFTTRTETRMMALLGEMRSNGEMIEKTNGHSNGQTLLEE